MKKTKIRIFTLFTLVALISTFFVSCNDEIDFVKENTNEENSENFIPFELASQVAIRASSDNYSTTRTNTTKNLTLPENKTVKSTFPVKDENLNIVYYIITLVSH